MVEAREANVADKQAQVLADAIAAATRRLSGAARRRGATRPRVL